MLDWLNEIKSTIDNNKEELTKSLFDMNDLVVNDILSNLGYDRRHNKNIIKLRNREMNLDWIIYKNNKIIGVRTGLLDEYISGIQVLPEAITTNYKNLGELIAFIVINGTDIAVFSPDMLNKEIVKIKLFEEDEDVEKIFTCISEMDDVIGCAKTIADGRFDNIVRDLINNKDIDFISDSFKNKYNLTINNKDKFYTSLEKVFKNNISESIKAEISENNTDNTQELLNEIEELNSTIKELEDYRDKTEEEKEIIIRDYDDKINKLNDYIAELSNKNNEKEEKIAQLSEEIVNLNNNKNTIENVPNDLNNKEYIKQIQNLHVEISELQDKLNEKNTIIDELKAKIENKVDPKIAENKNLLNAIDEPTDGSITYAGVVDGTLFQEKELKKFIGSAINELYNKVSFELMPYLFDGDIFRITDKSVNYDMIINNKYYDIDLSEISENDALIRLNTLFSKFPAIKFFYKVLGLNAQNNKIEENTDEIIDEADEFESRELFKGEVGAEIIDDAFTHDDGQFIDSDNITDEDTNNTYENIQDDLDLANVDLDKVIDSMDKQANTDYVSDSLLGILSESDIEEGEVIEEGEAVEKDNDTSTIKNGEILYGFSIVDFKTVVNDNNFNIKALKLIGNSNITYNLSGSNPDEQVTSLLGAIPLLSGNYEESIKALSEDSFHIPFVTNESSDNDSIKIPYTMKYANCNTMNDAIDLIIYMCNICGIDTNEIYIYVNANDNNGEYSENIVDDNIETQPEEILDVNIPDINNNIHCIISGSILRDVIINEHFEDILKNTIRFCIAIKTKYFESKLEDINDTTYAITEILAQSQLPIDETLYKLGNVIGTNYKVISSNKDEVSEDCFTTELNGDTYYISKMEPWQLTYEFIKMHYIGSGDLSISIRVILYSDAIEAYKEFYSNYANIEGAIKSYIIYVSARLK